MHCQEGNTDIFFLGGGNTNKCNHDCDQALTKSGQGSAEQTYISELMLWSELMLHRIKFMNVKQVKIPSLVALQVAKYMKTIIEI